MSILYNYAAMHAGVAALNTVIANGQSVLATGEGIKSSLGASWMGLSGTAFMDGYTKAATVAQNNVDDATRFMSAIGAGTENMAGGEAQAAAYF